MKVRISYGSNEAKNAAALVEDINRRFPDAHVKSSDKHPPYLHLYITTNASQYCGSLGKVIK